MLIVSGTPSLPSFSSLSCERLDIVKKQKMGLCLEANEMACGVQPPPIPRWLLNYIPHPRLQRGRKIVKWRFQGAVYLWIRKGPCLAQYRPHCHSRLGTGLANKMTEEMVICRKGRVRCKELMLKYKCFCINILQLKCQWCVCTLSVDLRHNKCSVMHNTFGNI